MYIIYDELGDEEKLYDRYEPYCIMINEMLRVRISYYSGLDNMNDQEMINT